MKQPSRSQMVARIIRAAGIDLHTLYLSLRGLPAFIRCLKKYKQNEPDKFPLRISDMFPILGDRYEQAGRIDFQYFYQDLWAARRIYQCRPNEHLDIGSRIDGFVAHLLTFMPVKIIDIREFDSMVEGLSFIQADATDLSHIKSNSVPSLSSLHAVEHFGLGRYGDTIDPASCFIAMEAFSRILKPKGRFYFSVPIGRERVEFNAHRIFNPMTIAEALPNLNLLSFSVIDDNGYFREDVNPEDYISAWYSCGLYEFQKL